MAAARLRNYADAGETVPHGAFVSIVAIFKPFLSSLISLPNPLGWSEPNGEIKILGDRDDQRINVLYSLFATRRDNSPLSDIDPLLFRALHSASIGKIRQPLGRGMPANLSDRHQNAYLSPRNACLGRQRHIHGQVFQSLCFWPSHGCEVAPQTVKRRVTNVGGRKSSSSGIGAISASAACLLPERSNSRARFATSVAPNRNFLRFTVVNRAAHGVAEHGISFLQFQERIAVKARAIGVKFDSKTPIGGSDFPARWLQASSEE